MPQHQRSLLPHQRQQQPTLIRLRQPRQPRPQTLRARTRTRRGIHPPNHLHLRNLIEERAGATTGEGQQQTFPVHRQNREQPLVLGDHTPQLTHRVRRSHRLRAHAVQATHHSLVSGHTHTGPRTPRHTRPDQPPRTPPLDQRLQRGIRRRIVALTLTTPRTRHRRERHKQRQRLHKPSSQLIQMNRRINLRPPHPRKPLRRQSLHHTVIQHPRRMHHTTQRKLRRNPRQHSSHVRFGGRPRGKGSARSWYLAAWPTLRPPPTPNSPPCPGRPSRSSTPPPGRGTDAESPARSRPAGSPTNSAESPFPTPAWPSASTAAASRPAGVRPVRASTPSLRLESVPGRPFVARLGPQVRVRRGDAP